MSKKYGTFSGDLLTIIGEATGLFAWPLEYTESWRYKQLKNRKSKFIYDNLYKLKSRGLVREISKNGKHFMELTKKGQMETLFLKAYEGSNRKQDWDGKWRLAIFDIPEDTKDKREKLRRLLRQNGFVKLQASVFISPYQLNRAAVEYLKASGLIEFIRLARIDDLDDDKDLRKHFKLP